MVKKNIRKFKFIQNFNFNKFKNNSIIPYSGFIWCLSCVVNGVEEHYIVDVTNVMAFTNFGVTQHISFDDITNCEGFISQFMDLPKKMDIQLTKVDCVSGDVSYMVLLHGCLLSSITYSDLQNDLDLEVTVDYSVVINGDLTIN